MNIIVFGSTGGIGKHVIEQAVAAGHQVTAVARRPQAITLRHPCLDVVKGDVMDAPFVMKAVKGQQAVISSIGTAKSEPTTLYSDGLANIISAMQVNGVRRVVCVSASGIDPGVWWQKLIARPLLWYFLKDMYTDLVRMETNVRRSDLDWTIVRPPRLTDKPRTGRYNIAVNKPLTSGMMISRADVADCILRNLDNPAYSRAIVELAY